MRRMTTTKQLNYINELSQVAEKGFKIGTYPEEMNVDGIFNLNHSVSAWDENEEIDFNTHTVSSGAFFYFEYPELWIHYGLSETGGPEDVGYVGIYVEEQLTFPENINTVEDLKKYLESSSGQNSLATLLDNNEVAIDETMIQNRVATYNALEFGGFLIKNGQLTAEATALECLSGEGEEIINAPDPAGVNTLQVENLEVENVFSENIQPWYSLFGTFDDDDDYTYTIVPYPTRKNDINKYEGVTIFIEGSSSERKSIFVDFENEKIYAEDGQTELILGMAAVQLVNMLNGEIVQSIDI